jgi:hypothetical protein
MSAKTAQAAPQLNLPGVEKVNMKDVYVRDRRSVVRDSNAGDYSACEEERDCAIRRLSGFGHGKCEAERPGVVQTQNRVPIVCDRAQAND